jgi:hypothetical protein
MGPHPQVYRQQHRPPLNGPRPSQHQYQRPPLPSPMVGQSSHPPQQQYYNQSKQPPQPHHQYQNPTNDARRSPTNQVPVRPAWDDEASESSGTYNDDTPEGRAGPAGPRKAANFNVPARSYALNDDKGIRTNLGNTSFVMALLSEMWLLNLVSFHNFYILLFYLLFLHEINF